MAKKKTKNDLLGELYRLRGQKREKMTKRQLEFCLYAFSNPTKIWNATIEEMIEDLKKL